MGGTIQNSKSFEKEIQIPTIQFNKRLMECLLSTTTQSLQIPSCTLIIQNLQTHTHSCSFLETTCWNERRDIEIERDRDLRDRERQGQKERERQMEKSRTCSVFLRLPLIYYKLWARISLVISDTDLRTVLVSKMDTVLIHVDSICTGAKPMGL